MRINKLLSNSGFCSRREANRLIEENRITVNGMLCEKGQWVEIKDVILIDNKPIPIKDKIYIALNKPVGITCTAAKEVKGNIIDFINYPEYIFPVGRLDKESQGLILLTNDGELANNILESENEHEKEYIVTVNKPFDDYFIKAMSKGVEICGVKTKTCKVIRVKEDTFRIILTQGLNKQIRRMTKAFGYSVVELKRIRIVNIKIDGIDMGKWRKLTEEELAELMDL
ncbi:ribosomal large subunit pseudouridine synthase F [Clostridium pasteurianum DSM 525 = ATCC 6013]|uniref:Pseudouridine synthase n=1 Tax=Clostridium pasteurianum DSM 525 = ATCC 6013 TaxID=1262449 RepID=A0A0H3J6L8_CLOPA|nr:pseudouridine synthase [Clostridium pasteurianum]AJA49094.1 ribosomal large subunit pseudouridine synthase F [Clostridium pasteurianum DSM 525 = ATCC 6013]AJA53082.1 ribosomal large subunit pseudouridine synthase F [Clostridium pasteurianum DSM 525 = ATCC 6013]AOZ76294.1 23S rRNA pseudouridine synthase F [Clostridium pasteurianum DSM 525 = ATCC 6013]AOZ80090.1 23S rRNA pseudouridine synthase F [Clostridium pasteurianum]ELP59031.1 pseudouridine synthase [Clostridium pasteurianum DSM 525 = AT